MLVGPENGASMDDWIANQQEQKALEAEIDGLKKELQGIKEEKADIGWQTTDAVDVSETVGREIGTNMDDEKSSAEESDEDNEDEDEVDGMGTLKPMGDADIEKYKTWLDTKEKDKRERTKVKRTRSARETRSNFLEVRSNQIRKTSTPELTWIHGDGRTTIEKLFDNAGLVDTDPDSDSDADPAEAEDDKDGPLPPLMIPELSVSPVPDYAALSRFVDHVKDDEEHGGEVEKFANAPDTSTHRAQMRAFNKQRAAHTVGVSPAGKSKTMINIAEFQAFLTAQENSGWTRNIDDESDIDYGSGDDAAMENHNVSEAGEEDVDESSKPEVEDVSNQEVKEEENDNGESENTTKSEVIENAWVDENKVEE